jgi:hypothetical protein
MTLTRKDFGIVLRKKVLGRQMKLLPKAIRRPRYPMKRPKKIEIPGIWLKPKERNMSNKTLPFPDNKVRNVSTVTGPSFAFCRRIKKVSSKFL